MQFQYSPYMLPLVGAALISGWVVVYVGRRQATRSAPALGLLALALVVWSLGYALELAGADLPTKLYWAKAQYFGIVAAPLLWFIFAFNHFHQGQALTRRHLALLAVIPLITVALVRTNEFHHLIWQDPRLMTIGDFTTLDLSRHGFWFWVHSGYSYLLLAFGSSFIVRSIGRMPGLQRGQAPVLLTAVFVPWVVNFLYLASLTPIDLTPFALSLAVVALTLSLLRFQLIDLTPVARDRVVDEMQDGMIVLDAQSRVVDINPAAQRLIERSASQTIGRTISEVFSAWPHLAERYSDVLEAVDEITTDSGAAQRWFELRLSPLNDQRQRLLGRVLILRDITKRKQVEDRLMQERNLLRTLIDNVPDQIFVHDTAGRFVLSNQSDARVMGVDDPELLPGKNDFDFYPPELAAQYQADDLTVVQSGRPIFNREEQVGEVDGQPRWALTTKVPLRDRQGQIIGLVGIAHDITARKQVEEALRKSKAELELRVAERTIELTAANERLQIQLIVLKQAEAALRESERFARSTLDALYAQIAILDERGTILTVNQAWRDFAQANGGSEEAVSVGVNYLGVCDAAQGPQSDEAGLFAAGVRSVANGTQAYFTLEYPCHSPAEQRWFYSRVTRFSGNGPIRIAVVHEDITERKQAEDALRDSEHIFRSFLEQSEDAIMLANNQGVIVQWSKGAEGLTGFSREESLGRPIWDIQFRSAPDEFKSAEHYERIKGSLQTVLLTGQGPSIRNLVEAVIQRPDGTRSITQTLAFPIRTDKGFMLGSILRDITERKHAEEALRRSETRFRALIENAPDGITLLSVDGRILYASPASLRIMGYSTEEMLAQNPLANIHPDDQAVILGVLTDLLPQPGRVATAQYRVRHADGSWRWIESTLTNLLAESSIGAIVFNYRDITDRRQADANIQRHTRHLAILHDIDRAITSTLDLDQVLILLLDHVRQASEAEACSVALVARETGDLIFRQAVGAASEVIIGLHLKAGQGLAGWVAAHRRTALVPDAASDPRFFREVDNRTGFVTRDLMAVPLIIRDTVVGVIELLNKRSGAFGEEDVQLLESVAAQAAVAIENAQLFETERAGRQRLEALYQIGQTINSILDSDAILGQLTDAAMRATHATHGAALIVSPDQVGFRRRSLRGFSPELAAKALVTQLPLDQGVNGRAYQTHQAIYLSDVRTDPNYFPLIADTRSELAVPILRSGQVLGNLDLQSPEVDAFRDVDLDFLQALTAQVAIALENARLFAETRRRLDEMSVVSNVALVGAAGRPFDEAVARATEALARLWPDTSLGYMFVDKGDQSLRLHPSYHGYAPEVSTRLRIPLGRGIVGYAARARQPIRVSDVRSDSRYMVIDPAARSEMAAPLVAGDSVVGVVSVISPQLDAFSGEDLRLLTTLAGQLATIFEKARLDAALEAERASLARRVEERTLELRAANEQLRQAHDEVSHALIKEKELGELKTRFVSMTSHEFRTPLTVIQSSAELLERYRHKWTTEKQVEVLQRIQTATKNMTALLEDVLLAGKIEASKLDFKPGPLNLEKFCRDMVEELQLGLGAKHLLVLTIDGDSAQTYMDEKLLRHILSNVLSNAIKYSPPGSQVDVALTCRAGQATLIVRDRGIGIPLADQAHLFEAFHRAGNVSNTPGTGLGLTILKKSVDVHGGTIAVNSQVGAGTTITVTLPMNLR